MANQNLIDFLSDFVTEQRLEVINKNLVNRTRYITLAIEDIFQPHNASAILRTADCFGIQDIHIIENKHRYNVNPDVVVGSSQWLNIHKYYKTEENTLSTIDFLRSKGYRIIATTPHTNDTDLPDFDITKGKCALFFGTEQHGLSDNVIENADECVKIPMYGFTESFNISVSAAITLYELTRKLRDSDIKWALTESESSEIKLQ